MMVVVTLFFIILVPYTISFYHEMNMTNNHLEQLTLESLMQMGYHSYMQEEQAYENVRRDFHYSFPEGKVTVTSTWTDHESMTLYILAETKGKAISSILKKDKIHINE